MTALNKYEGLIARLERHRHNNQHCSHVNPDGPEAARAIQDLEEEVEALKDFIEAITYRDGGEMYSAYREDVDLLEFANLKTLSVLASTADG